MILISKIRRLPAVGAGGEGRGLSGRAWLVLAAMLGGGWFGGSAPAHSADGTWSLTTANGNWATAGNWVGGTIAKAAGVGASNTINTPLTIVGNTSTAASGTNDRQQATRPSARTGRGERAGGRPPRVQIFSVA